MKIEIVFVEVETSTITKTMILDYYSGMGIDIPLNTRAIQIRLFEEVRE